MVEIGILGSSIGLLLVVILAVIVPITLAVEASKDQIFVLFLAVPSIVVRSLRTQCQKKLDQMLAEIEDDENISDEGESDEESDAGGMAGQGGVLDWSRLKLKERKREFKKSGLVYLRLLMRFLLPLLLFMGFYVGIFMWSRIVRGRAGQDGNGVLQMQQRRTYLLNTEYLTSECVGAEDPVWAAQACARGDQSANDLLWIHDQLMYGSEYPFDLRAVLLDSNKQSELMLLDGCMGTAELAPEDIAAAVAGLDLNVENTDIDELLDGHAIVTSTLLSRTRCITFYNGLLQSGAHAALIEFASVSREVLHERQYEVLVAPPSNATGNGTARRLDVDMHPVDTAGSNLQGAAVDGDGPA